VTLDWEYHPTLPRRGEWRCALETPELFMWQPQFLVRRVTSSVHFDEEDTVLLGVMRTPDCQEGVAGVLPGETLVIMARLDGMRQATTDSAGGQEAGGVNIELEAIVFDIPAEEGAALSGGIEGLADEERFAALMKRVNGTDVKLAAHVAVAVNPGFSARLGSTEEVRTVTEVDPPRENAPSRYRPTAVDVLPCGTQWEVTARLSRPDNPLLALAPMEIHLSHHLQHDVERPREPNYEDVIAEALASPVGDVPQAIVLQESWEGEARLAPGKVRFIGLREPPSDAFKGRVHAAFLRARVKEVKEGSEPARVDPVDPFAPPPVRK
jgi:hypothetical protein